MNLLWRNYKLQNIFSADMHDYLMLAHCETNAYPPPVAKTPPNRYGQICVSMVQYNQSSTVEN